MLFVREPEKVQLEIARLYEANLFEKLIEVARRTLRNLRPKGQTLFFREIPAIIQELVGNLWDFVLEHIWMDGDCVDDEALSVHVSALTFLVASSQLSDQSSSSHLVKVQRSGSIPRFSAQQFTTRPYGRIAKVEIVLFVRIHEAQRRPADDRVCVFVPRDSKIGAVVREVFHQHVEDHRPDLVVGVQELGGRVVFEVLDKDVCHGAKVGPVGVSDVDE